MKYVLQPLPSALRVRHSIFKASGATTGDHPRYPFRKSLGGNKPGGLIVSSPVRQGGEIGINSILRPEGPAEEWETRSRFVERYLMDSFLDAALLPAGHRPQVGRGLRTDITRGIGSTNVPSFLQLTRDLRNGHLVSQWHPCFDHFTSPGSGRILRPRGRLPDSGFGEHEACWFVDRLPLA